MLIPRNGYKYIYILLRIFKKLLVFSKTLFRGCIRHIYSPTTRPDSVSTTTNPCFSILPPTLDLQPPLTEMTRIVPPQEEAGADLSPNIISPHMAASPVDENALYVQIDDHPENVFQLSFVTDNSESLPLSAEKYFPITPFQLPSRRRVLDQRDDPLDVIYPFANRAMSPESAQRGFLPPFTLSLDPNLIPAGWKPLIHPQGVQYFWNEQKRTLTNTYLYDQQLLEETNSAIDHIYSAVSSQGWDLPADVQLVIALHRAMGNIRVGYYFVNPRRRCLFWLTEKRVDRWFKRVRGVQSHAHIKYVMEAEYWLHFQLFPHVQTLSLDICRELKGLLVYSSIDQSTSVLSTAESSLEDLDRHITLVESMCTAHLTNHSSISYYAWSIGSLMAGLALQKFDNFHGQRNTRWLRNDLTTVETQNTRFHLYAMKLISPILFFSPESYFHSLKSIIVGDAFFYRAWADFVKELHAEWNNLIIIATVLLATNVAFLAIPSVDVNPGSPSRSAVQILSYLSVLASVSSIILGQLLARYHRIKGWENFDERIEDNFDFLMELGTHILAVMYSLPYALLSWGMITFLAAFLALCFQFTGKSTRLLIGVAVVMIGIIVLWCVWMAWGTDRQRWLRSRLLSKVTRIRQLFQTRRRGDSVGVNP